MIITYLFIYENIEIKLTKILFQISFSFFSILPLLKFIYIKKLYFILIWNYSMPHDPSFNLISIYEFTKWILYSLCCRSFSITHIYYQLLFFDCQKKLKCNTSTFLRGRVDRAPGSLLRFFISSIFIKPFIVFLMRQTFFHF